MTTGQALTATLLAPFAVSGLVLATLIAADWSRRRRAARAWAARNDFMGGKNTRAGGDEKEPGQPAAGAGKFA